MSYDCTENVLNHKKMVKELISTACAELLHRAEIHDNSKLESPEKEEFDKSLEISLCSYGSKEYFDKLEIIKKALQYHYSKNSHHPEYYGYAECNNCHKQFPIDYPHECSFCGCNQLQLRPNISGMDLFDILEMFIDWAAATTRHTDGDILKSIEVNKSKLNMSDQLVEIFKNTARNFKENKNG